MFSVDKHARWVKLAHGGRVRLAGPQRGGSTKPTTPVMYMDSLRMVKVFFDFIISIFWYTMIES